MTGSSPVRRVVLPIALLLIASLPAPAVAQDTIAKAKGLYESADYEQALQVLDNLTGKDVTTEAAAYQVFCLMALGRIDQARLAIESIVHADPLYLPSGAQVSPRIRTFFEDVRKPLLPDVVRESYTRAKSMFDQKDFAPALGEFNKVIALIDEVGDADPSAADLRTLATGFRDLAKAALAPPRVEAPPSAPPAPAPMNAPLLLPPEPVVYGPEDTDVKAPVALTKKLPEWRPENPTEEKMSYHGAIELVIDEVGRVISASLLESVLPRYDGPLLEAAKHWSFRPATLGGVPVRYRYAVAIRLGR
jgi:tetratricopeptide (TPR) repeat protein